MLSFISPRPAPTGALLRLSGIPAVLDRDTTLQLHEQQHAAKLRGRQSGPRDQCIHTGWVVTQRVPQALVVGACGQVGSAARPAGDPDPINGDAKTPAQVVGEAG